MLHVKQDLSHCRILQKRNNFGQKTKRENEKKNKHREKTIQVSNFHNAAETDVNLTNQAETNINSKEPSFVF